MKLRLALSILLLSRLGSAQAPTAAELLFREGRQASDAGDQKRACEAFQASLELESTRGTRLNLALCQIQLGRLLEASENLKLVSAQLAPGDERLPIVAENLAAIAKRLSRIDLRLDVGLPDTAELRLDGQRIALTGTRAPLVLNPGNHLLELSAPERRPARLRVALAEGEARTETLSLDPAVTVSPVEPNARPSQNAVSPPTQTTPARDEPSARRQVGFAFLGLGGAGLVAAGISGALMLREHGIVERECRADMCSPEGLAAGARGRTLVVVSAASLGATLLGGAVGVYLLASSPRRSAVSAALQIGPESVSLRLATTL